MTDPIAFKKESNHLESPARSAAAITPSDGADLTETTRAIYIGGNGDITVDMDGDGVGILFQNVVSGTILPLRITKVYLTGTSATSLIALY